MLICQICNIREAKVHFTRIINNQKIEMYVCEICAKENDELKFNLNKLLSSIIGLDIENSEEPDDSASCESCGLTIEEFKTTGKMGCPECYKYFAEYMDTLLKRIHGSVKHQGKIPGNIKEQIQEERALEDLRLKLKECIEKEAYEKAAVIRDEIKEIEKKKSE